MNQVLSPELDQNGSREALDASKVFVKNMKALSSWSRADSWPVLPRMAFLYTLPVYILHLFGNVYMDAALFEKFWNIPLLRWPYKWRRGIYGTDLKTLLALKISDQGITAKKSIIPNADAVMNLFTS